MGSALRWQGDKRGATLYVVSRDSSSKDVQVRPLFLWMLGRFILCVHCLKQNEVRVDYNDFQLITLNLGFFAKEGDFIVSLILVVKINSFSRI